MNNKLNKLRREVNIIKEALDGFAEKSFSGLGRAKPGDMIEIGFEGANSNQSKLRTRVDKIINKNGQKLIQDAEGNLFFPDGRIFKAKSAYLTKYVQTSKNLRGKIVPRPNTSARQITKKEEVVNIKKGVAEYFRKFDWMKLTPAEMLEVGKIIHVGFSQLEKIKDL